MIGFKKFVEALKFPQPNANPAAYQAAQQAALQRPSAPRPNASATSGQAELNLGIPHLPLLQELGIKQPGHFYRAVKEYGAIEDFLKSGVVRNSDGTAPMYAPDAFPKYMFRGTADTGYVFEMLPPNGHLQTPNHAGLDPTMKQTYKTAVAPTPKEHVTRIIEIKKLPLDVPRGGYKNVQWRVIWKG